MATYAASALPEPNATALPSAADALPALVTVADAQWTRAGDDLVIQLWSETYVIKDYFIQPQPLLFDDGSQLALAQVNARLITMPNYQLAAEAVTGIAPSTEPVGIATTVVNGPISVTDTRGVVREVKQGDPIYLNDTLQTPSKGYIKITFNDGSLFQLGPLARAQIEQYSYESDSAGGEMESSVFVGFFRFISGQISGDDEGRQHTTIKTPSATIGIRGSEIDGYVSEDGATTILHTEGLIDITPLFSLDSFSVYQPGTRIYIDLNSVSTGMASSDFIDQFRDNLAPLSAFTPQNDALLQPPPPPRGALAGEHSAAGDERPGAPNQPRPPQGAQGGERRGEQGTAQAEQPLGEPAPDGMRPYRPHVPPGQHPSEQREGLNPPDPFAPPANSDRQPPPPGSSQTASDPDNRFSTDPPGASSDSNREAMNHEPATQEPTAAANEQTKYLTPLQGETPTPPAPPTLNSNEFLEDLTQVIALPGLAEVLPLQLVQIIPPSHGTVVYHYNGSVSYVPNPNFVGQDRFAVQAGPDAAPITQTVEVARPLLDLPTPFTEASQIVTQPSQGQVVINTDFSLSYLPNANYTGADRFSYRPTANAAEVTVELRVLPSNDAPQARPDQFSTQEDVALVMPIAALLANDSDIEGSSLTLTDAGRVQQVTRTSTGETTTSALNGSTLSGDAELLRLELPPHFNGEAVFFYRVSDAAGAADVTQVTVTVTAQNDAPQAMADTVQLAAGNNTIASSTLLQNDTDVDGDPLQILAVGDAVNGNVVLAGNMIVFNPADTTLETGRFSYTISDGNLTSRAEVTVLLSASQPPPVSNQAPLAIADQASLGSASSVVINVLANDRDPEGGALTLQQVSDAFNGSVQINADNTITFTRAQGTEFDATFNGGFRYTIADTEGATASTTVQISGQAIATTLQTQPDSVSMVQNSALTLAATELLQNDSGDGLTLTAVSTEAANSVSLNADGTILFTPAADLSGQTTFNYQVQDQYGNQAIETVQVAVNAVPNQAPIAQADQLTTNKNTALSIAASELLANDSDPEQQPLLLTSVSAGNNGTVTLSADNTVLFQPNADFAGVADFSYTVFDSVGASSRALVTVTVANQPPQAVADSLNTGYNEALTVASAELLANDSDPDLNEVLTIVSVDNAQHGTVELQDGTVLFSPEVDFSGVASFEYTVADSSGALSRAPVTVSVAPPTGAIQATTDTVSIDRNETVFLDPAALLGNDFFSNAELEAAAVIANVGNASNGTVRLDPTTQQVIFTPNTDFVGTAGFDYTLQANELSSVAPVTVTVLSTPVQAVDDRGFFVATDQRLSLDSARLLSNDLSPDGLPLSLTSVSNAQGGQVQLSLSSDIIEFIPAPGSTGIATFDYEVSDGNSSDVGTVFIDVQASNQAPTANPDAFEIPFGQTTILDSFALLANDVDPDPGDLLTIEGIDALPPGLSVTLVDNRLQLFADYTALTDLNETGFEYVVSDGQNTATGTVTLTPTNITVGTSGNDTFAPQSPELEVMSGLAGADQFAAPGPQDVLLGGAGTDTFALDSNPAPGATINGGTEQDSLVLSGGDGQILNLMQNSSLSSDQALNLSGIDQIDLSTGNNQQLVIGLNEVLAMSDAGSLLIDGTASSMVNSTGQGWSNTGITSIDGATYNSYSASGAELLVSTDILLQFVS